MKKVAFTRPRHTATQGSSERRFVGQNVGMDISPKGINISIPSPTTKNEEKTKRVALVDDEGYRNKLDPDDIMKLVEALPVKERRQILAKLSLVSQQPDVEAIRDQDMWAQAVYEGLTAANGHGDGAGQGPMVVKRVVAAPAAWRPVADFMEASRLDTLKVVERRSVYDMLAKLVIEKAQWISRERGAPLSPKLVGSVSSNVASIFDQAFPGYLASGLALIVARRLLSGYRPGSE